MSRKMPTDREGEAAARHAQLTGEVIWAWNELHSAFALAFHGLATPGNPYMAMCLWNSIAGDQAQRDMVGAAVEAAMNLDRRLKERLEWSLKMTGKLAVHRNDLVHGLVGFRHTEKGLTTTFAAFGNNFPRYRRHAERDGQLSNLMTDLRGDLMALATYTAEVTRAALAKIENRDGPPVPRRPRLKLVKTDRPRKKQKGKPKGRRTKP